MSLQSIDITSEALMAEQARVQPHKFQGRMLTEYDHLLITDFDSKRPDTNEMTDFLQDFHPVTAPRIGGVLEGMQREFDREVVWADMGGGLGLPMREISTLQQNGTHGVAMYNVDFFDWDFSKIDAHDWNFLDAHFPDIMEDVHKPTYVHGDVQSIELPEPADLITSVEVVQYLHNPLKALAQWYNQLSDDGLMMIAANRRWSEAIRYGESGTAGLPIEDMVDHMREVGVDCAAVQKDDYPDGFRPLREAGVLKKLAVAKLPGTKMVVNAPVERIWLTGTDFKVIDYTEPGPDDPPVVEIIAD